MLYLSYLHRPHTDSYRIGALLWARSTAPCLPTPDAIPKTTNRPPATALWKPLPRPLHLSRGTIAAMAMASIEEAAELKRAASDAEVARRAEELESRVPSIAPAAAAQRAEASATAGRPVASAAASAAAGRVASDAASPYARMGIVEDAQPAFGDLDAVLRRRRQVG